MNKKFKNVTSDADVPAAINATFKQLERDTAHMSAAECGGCTCTMAVRFNDTAVFFVQCGDGIVLTTGEDGKIVCEMSRHSTTNPVEIERIAKVGPNLIVEGRLCHILEPTRGFGNGDLRKGTVFSHGMEFKNIKGALISTPEIYQLSEDEMLKSEHLVVASDGLEFPGWDFNRDFSELMGNHQYQKVLDIAIKKSADDITLVVIPLSGGHYHF